MNSKPIKGITNIDLFNYNRRVSTEARVGSIGIGGENPIRLQSMTTTDTNDIEASVAQTERIIKAGGELVRLTTQGKKEARSIGIVNEELRRKGYNTPLVADVHFNANVADMAAELIDKVRINPGNYVDPGRTFKQLEYTDEEYALELEKIGKRFVPLLNICKEHKTAIRIGVNHGSLSDRIMSHYGDTPEGIVESCMEFLRICKKENFNDVVISIKASNTVVLVRSMRLLVATMNEEGMSYPLHLGVTEAGEGEDGRIKSAVGIGTLLADGIGDTIRVSLSEEPEEEIPVAKALADYVSKRIGHLHIPGEVADNFNYFAPERRKTQAVGNIGGENVLVVISSQLSFSDSLSKDKSQNINEDLSPDYIYIGNKISNTLDHRKKYIIDYTAYMEMTRDNGIIPYNFCPIFPYNAIPYIGAIEAKTKFLVLPYGANSDEYIACLRHHPEVVAVVMSNHPNALGERRALAHELTRADLQNPIIFALMYRFNTKDKDLLQLYSAVDFGPLGLDGLADGIWLMNDGDIPVKTLSDTAFGVLQAARLRTTKTEYISCPGCGRTLYNLRTTIARIKEATTELKNLKIGIMGCIVNGPGEMADADYGYVGAGPRKVSLYRKKECVEHNIDEEDAVEHLLALIRRDQNESSN